MGSRRRKNRRLLWRKIPTAVAERLYIKLLDLYRRVFGTDAPNLGSALRELGRTYVGQGRLDKAEQAYLDAIEVRDRAFGQNNLHTLSLKQELAELYVRQERYDEAEAHFLGVLSAWAADKRWGQRQTIERLVALYDAWGKPEKAAEWRSDFKRIFIATMCG